MKYADGSGKHIQNIYKRVLKGTENFIKYNYIYYIGGLNVKKGKDIMWYIWLSPDSPLYGKDKMATFERYFLAEK